MMQIEPEQRRQLDEEGFVVLPEFFDAQQCYRFCRRVNELMEAEGTEAGSEFKTEPGSVRLANLVNKDPMFRELITHPRLLPFLEIVLGKRFKLSSLNARTALPHNQVAQPLHVDMGAIPDEQGFWVCNTIWMLDDFTLENGPTRVVPGSHRSGRAPTPADDDDGVRYVTGQAGTVVVMNSHVWHGGSANTTAEPRRAIHAFYCRHDKPQQQYQKSLLSPKVQAQCTPKQREVLALDDVQNDRLSETVNITSGFMK